MKNIDIKSLIIGALLTTIMFLGACATTPTMKSVAGVYENATSNGTWKYILMKNGDLEDYYPGRLEREYGPSPDKGHWELVDGKIRITIRREQKDRTFVRILRINSDGSIKEIGFLNDGKPTPPWPENEGEGEGTQGSNSYSGSSGSDIDWIPSY